MQETLTPHPVTREIIADRSTGPARFEPSLPHALAESSSADRQRGDAFHDGLVGGLATEILRMVRVPDGSGSRLARRNQRSCRLRDDLRYGGAS